MKKSMLMVLIICLITIVCGCSKDYKYPSGRDTIEIYGDGRYQIMRSGSSSKTLMNVETQEDIEQNVYKYKEIKPLVYVIGKKGYTILNYKKNSIINYSNKGMIPMKQQKIFDKIENE
jgi:hypothetical protein